MSDKISATPHPQCPVHEASFLIFSNQMQAIVKQLDLIVTRLERIEQTQHERSELCASRGERINGLEHDIQEQATMNHDIWEAVNGLRWHIWRAVGAMAVIIPLTMTITGVITKHLCK